MDIINELDTIKLIISSGKKNIIDNYFKNYPLSVRQIIEEDFDTFEKIIKFKFDDIQLKRDNLKLSLEEIMDSYQFIENATNQRKSKYIRFEQIIHIWLKRQNFFEDAYKIKCIEYEVDINILQNELFNDSDEDNDENEYVEEESEELIEKIVGIQKNQIIKKIIKFIPRPNQQEAIDHIKKYGIITGIHCQATGCGKTAIIKIYIQENEKKYINSEKVSKVILFTERKSIFADLFEFKKDSNENHGNEHKENIKRWDETGECNLTNYIIINRVTIKKKDWIERLKSEKDKPILLVINRSYLTRNDYKKLTKEHVNLVIHDECHNTPSKECYGFLKHIKSLDIPIVGFSATPVRTGKKDKPKLLEIYHKSDDKTKLNLLTNYNMMKAISDDLILAPEFNWFVVNKYNKKNQEDNNVGEIEKQDIESAMKLLDEIVPNLPYKKIVAWCGLISMTDKWIKYFEENKSKYPSLKNFTFGIDTSKSDNTGYDNFKNSEGEAILFCANKHREGSDIKKLDCCIFLDKVKNRGAIPFIQSIGRVLRKTNDGLKKKGIIIDCVAKKGDNYDKEVIDKIIGYYLALQNMAEPENIIEQQYKMYTKILSDVKFDKDKNVIILNIGDKKNPITIKCNKLEWNNIMDKFDKILGVKLKMSEDTILKANFSKDIKINKKLKIQSDKEYYEKMEEYKLTPNPKQKYHELWTNWYDFLDVNTNDYPKFDKWYNKCLKYNLTTEKKYHKICDTFGLPHMPKELYKEFTTFEILFNNEYSNKRR